MVLKVVKYGNPVLRKKGARIETISPVIKQLTADMFETMYASRGIGLAVASCDYLSALRVRSARHGSRSPEESGDNLIFFGRDGTQVSCLSIVESCLIPARGKPVLYPVEFVP